MEWGEQTRAMREAELEKQKNSSLDFINSQLSAKQNEMYLIKKSIVHLRETNEDTRLFCVKNQDTIKYTQARMHANFDLVSVSGIYGAFSRSTYYEIKQFIKFNESIINVCSPTAPGDEAWVNREAKIYKLLDEEIHADELVRIEIAQATDKKTLHKLSIDYYNRTSQQSTY